MTMQTKNLAELYDLAPLEWSPVEARLQRVNESPEGGLQHHSCWLATVDPEGSPHVAAVGALWVDGAFWFKTGERTRKGRNLAQNGRATMSVATPGYDVVVEGVVEPVRDPEVVAAMAAHWAAGGWPTQPDETGIALTAPYSAPSAGPPPWTVYRLAPRRATAVGGEGSGGATTWTFD